MKKRFLGSVGLSLVLVAPSAWSQIPGQSPAWLQDRRYSEGPGIRTGDFELHPGIGGEVGYDSNFLLRTDKEPPPGNVIILNGAPTAPVEPAVRLRVTPSFSISTLGAQRKEGRTDQPDVNFRGSMAVSYLEFFGADIIQKQRNASATGRLSLGLFQGKPISGAFFAQYDRIVNPNAQGDLEFAYTQNRVGGGGEVTWNPGGGTLSYSLGYNLNAAIYDRESASRFNNLTHSTYVRGRWRFRPRTSLISDTSVGYQVWVNQDGQGALVNSTPVRTRFGLEGLLTPKLTLYSMVGYATTFLSQKKSDNIKNYDSVYANLRLGYFLTANPDSGDMQTEVSTYVSNISVGYTRDFNQSLMTNYSVADRGDISLTSYFGGQAVVTATGALSAVQYPDLPFTDGSGRIRQAAWTDWRPEVQVFGEYRFADSLGLNTTFRYMANRSPTRLLQTDPGVQPEQYFDLNWRRFEAYLGVRWFM